MTHDVQWPGQRRDKHGTRAKGSRFLFRMARLLETHSIPLTPEQLGVLEGLRAATAVAAVVAAAWLLHLPLLSWAAFAAFWTCLVDPGGADRSRLHVMGGFAIAGTIITALASAAANLGLPAAAAAVFVLVFICSLSRSLGTVGIQPGILASVVAVVAVSSPGAPLPAIELAGIFLAGCVWAMTLCFLIWRIHPHAPVRRAVVAVYGRLADMASDMLVSISAERTKKPGTRRLEADHRRSIRNAIERSYALLARLPDRHDAERNAIMAALDLADQLFAALIAVEHHIRVSGSSADYEQAQRLLEHMRLTLVKIQLQAGRRTPDAPSLATMAGLMAADGAASDPFLAKVNERCMAAIASAARQWLSLAPDSARHTPASFPAETATRLSVAPAVLHHALRTAIAVVAAFVVAEQLDLAHSYWATMATVVVMQPGSSATWRRSVERMLGSIVGGAGAAALLVLFHTPGALLLIIFPVAAATIALRSVSYTLYVAFLTPLFIFVSELLHPGHGIAWARAVDNIIGALIATTTSTLAAAISRASPGKRSACPSE
jgi:uncharacterized membrane protein YccC